jgi:hypothetical protein
LAVCRVSCVREKYQKEWFSFFFIAITFWVQPLTSLCAISYRFFHSVPTTLCLGSSRRLVFMLQLVFHALLISRALCVYIYIYTHTTLVIDPAAASEKTRQRPTFLQGSFSFLQASRFSQNISLYLFKTLLSLSFLLGIYICPIPKGAWLIRRESWNREWW